MPKIIDLVTNKWFYWLFFVVLLFEKSISRLEYDNDNNSSMEDKMKILITFYLLFWSNSIKICQRPLYLTKDDWMWDDYKRLAWPSCLPGNMYHVHMTLVCPRPWTCYTCWICFSENQVKWNTLDTTTTTPPQSDQNINFTTILTPELRYMIQVWFQRIILIEVLESSLIIINRWVIFEFLKCFEQEIEEISLCGKFPLHLLKYRDVSAWQSIHHTLTRLNCRASAVRLMSQESNFRLKTEEREDIFLGDECSLLNFVVYLA